jgi:hypothetical protein
VLGYIKFSPTSLLLYIQTEESDGLHKGVFSLHHLVEEGLSDCF